MSNIYIQEPPTSGKVLLQTTVGDIDIELWSKEAPKACRNFVQLCLEGYYNGTVFHRLVKGFIVQGGDPNGDGTGGESIYGQPFKDEFHTRLRFVRRGLVAMANSGKDDNGSQFFFTLGPTPELQNKNTVFGKVTGNTLYNMLKLEETLVDQDDRPLYPHKITSCKILNNPFPDIVPRVIEVITKPVPEKPKEKAKKNFSLLSFGEEAEEDEAEVNAVNEVYKGQSKSSHDLTNDPKLSSVPAVSLYEDEKSKRAADAETLDNVRKKLKKSDVVQQETVSNRNKNEEIDLETNAVVESEDKKSNEREEIRKQIKELKRELNKAKQVKAEDVAKEEATDEREIIQEDNEILKQYHKQLSLYTKKKKKLILAKGTTEREQQTLNYLKKFEEKLKKANKQLLSSESEGETRTDSDENESWLKHCLQADEEKVVIAKDANLPAEDRYDISDPRNRMTERRRNKNKH